MIQHKKISKTFIDSLMDISIEELKILKRLLLLKLETYYYPNDFFEQLEKDFRTTLKYVNFFVKKSDIEDIEKRYIIPNESLYKAYIQEIKSTSLEQYVQTYKALKLFKKENFLLKQQLEEAKKEKKLFTLFGIDIEHPRSNQLGEIKNILESNMDEKSYRQINSISKEKIDKNFALYLTKIESLKFKIREEDRKIIEFIRFYKWKLYLIRTLFITSFISILSGVLFYKTYMLSAIVTLIFITILYILLINKTVYLPSSLLTRIANIIEVKYKRREIISHRLIAFDNLLLHFIVWGSILYLGYVIISLFIDLFMAIGELFRTVSGDEK